MDTLKYKRQVRDHFNKTVHDEDTIDKVAEVIGYERRVEDGTIHSTVPVSRAGQTGHHS